jgi:hypothetical protein
VDTQSKFNDEITWDTLSHANSPADYDEGYFVSSTHSKHEQTRCTEVEIYHLRGLQVLRAVGVYTKQWEDGELLEHEVFDLEGLMCSTQFEFREVGRITKRQCLIAIWLPRRVRHFSSYHKTVSPDLLDEWTTEHPCAPELVQCKSTTPNTINCHLQHSRTKAEHLSGLRLRVPIDNSSEWLRFERFIKLVGDRILMAEDHRVSREALESLPGPLLGG